MCCQNFVFSTHVLADRTMGLHAHMQLVLVRVLWVL